MTQATRDQVEDAIRQYIDPYTERDLLATKSVKDIAIEDGQVKVKLQLGYPANGVVDGMRAELAGRISNIEGVGSVDVTVSTKVVSHAVQNGRLIVEGHAGTVSADPVCRPRLRHRRGAHDRCDPRR